MSIAFVLILGMIVLVPILAIVIDSPLSEALARRIAAKESDPGSAARIEALEQEMVYLTQTVESLREESDFVRSLVEGPERDRLPAPESRASPTGDPETS